MAKSKKPIVEPKKEQPEVKKPIQVQDDGMVIITGTGVGGLEKGKDYRSTPQSAQRLIERGHATKK